MRGRDQLRGHIDETVYPLGLLLKRKRRVSLGSYGSLDSQKDTNHHQVAVGLGATEVNCGQNPQETEPEILRQTPQTC
jgi:hypothetical protein